MNMPILAAVEQRLLDYLESSRSDWQTVAAMLHMGGGSAAHVYYMRGPVLSMDFEADDTDDAEDTVQPPTPYQLPPWLIHAVGRERLRLILDEHCHNITTPYCTQAEVFAYLYPSLDNKQPLIHEVWQRIFLWARNATLCQHANLFRESVGYAIQLDLDKNVPELLDETDQRNFHNIAQLIRGHVIEQGRQAGQLVRRITPPPPYNNSPPLPPRLNGPCYSFTQLYRPDTATPHLADELETYKVYKHPLIF